ncbi:MAG: ABC transporter permease [candidate division WOR-3 bacterium]|nr:MAG: ABC transporter permease [candidate division WOR-3 bacterium]
MSLRDNRKRMLKTFFHYLRAVNAENIKEWKIELTYKPDFIRQFIEPFVYLFPYFLYGFALLGGRYSEHLRSITGISDMVAYTFIGYLFIGFLNTACWAMGFSLRKEQWFGTLETIFVAPVPRWVYVAGMALHSTCHQGLIMLIQAVVIATFFAIVLQMSGIFMALSIVLLMLLGLYGLGIIVAGLTIALKQWWVVSEALSTLIVVVTPIAYPLAVLPLVLRKMSMFLPTTYGIIGVRHFLLGEELVIGLPTIILRLFLILIVWLTFGMIVFLVMDRYGRKKGSLSIY